MLIKIPYHFIFKYIVFNFLLFGCVLEVELCQSKVKMPLSC